MKFSRRTALKAGTVVAGVGLLGRTALSTADAHVSRSDDWGDQRQPEPYDDYQVHRVAQDQSGDFQTIQAAVNAAAPRDMILVEPGIYTEEVEINDTPRLTIRGTDRTDVIIDGEYQRYNGIVTTADETVVENLTVRNHNGNGVYWTNSVTGYRGSYITAVRNGTYGIYAFSSEHGRFEHCYAGGCDDAGYYIGESQPSYAVIDDCIAENNGLGYSGTNAGGDLVIKNSIWRHNAAGIVPNTLDSQANAPQGHLQGGIRIENNEIHDNNNMDIPMIGTAYAVSGSGIVVAGGVGNDILDNTIENHDKYGIAITPIITGENNIYSPKDNAVMNNVVRNSNRVDLALAAPADGNAFADNEFDSSRPSFIERRDGSTGDIQVFLYLIKEFMQAEEIGTYPEGAIEDIPDPDPATLQADHDDYEMAAPDSEPPKPAVGRG